MYSKINDIENQINKLEGKREDLISKIEENNIELRLNKKEKEDISKCMKVLSAISQNNQDKVKQLFEQTISSGLKDLFDDSYDFQFLMKTRGDSSACDFQLKSKATKDNYLDIPMCRGKSIQEIVGVILRMILIKLDRKSHRILILDEAFSGLKDSRQRLASKFMADICEKFEIQLIAITHNEQFKEFAGQEITIG